MELIPHDGISLISITRGFLGISTILVIAYLLSNNKKNIDWKTIGIGVLSQLIIAIGVIKVDAVAIFFEKIGEVFLAIVVFTNAGTKVLFGELADSEKYGAILHFRFSQLLYSFLL